MTFATEVRKLTESKPFYAVAGAGDFAIEKLREIPERLERLQSRSGELGQTARDIPVKARNYAAKAEEYAKDFPVRAKSYADVVGERATEIYDEFAARGRKIVSKTSRDAALQLEDVSETAGRPAAKRQGAKPGPKPGARSGAKPAARKTTTTRKPNGATRS
jgi:ElaB/YqjD/DUF883 family membrane-anchored ribosome-binding protein